MPATWCATPNARCWWCGTEATQLLELDVHRTQRAEIRAHAVAGLNRIEAGAGAGRDNLACLEAASGSMPAAWCATPECSVLGVVGGISYGNNEVTAVLRQSVVAGQQVQWLADRLRQQEAIEWIGMSHCDVVGSKCVSPRHRQWRDAGLKQRGFEAIDVDVELPCGRLYCDLPDRDGTDIDRCSRLDEATRLRIDPAFILAQPDNNIRIEQQPHVCSGGSIGPFNIASRMSSGRGASMASTT